MQVDAGDVLIIPAWRCAYRVERLARHCSSTAARRSRKYLAGKLNTMRLGGGGEMTRFICGYFGCERHADRLFLAGLPPMIRINIRGDAAGAWLESSIRHLVSEAASERPGNRSCCPRWPKRSSSRRCGATWSNCRPSRPAGSPARAIRSSARRSRSCIASRTMPGRLTSSPQEAGASRSVLPERFARYLGEPPLTYLARWRLQLAATPPGDDAQDLLQLASDVGYESEAAFNRAFKREFGLPPGQYRKRASGIGHADVAQRPRSVTSAQ